MALLGLLRLRRTSRRRMLATSPQASVSLAFEAKHRAFHEIPPGAVARGIRYLTSRPGATVRLAAILPYRRAGSLRQAA